MAIVREQARICECMQASHMVIALKFIFQLKKQCRGTRKENTSVKQKRNLILEDGTAFLLVESLSLIFFVLNPVCASTLTLAYCRLAQKSGNSASIGRDPVKFVQMNDDPVQQNEFLDVLSRKLLASFTKKADREPAL